MITRFIIVCLLVIITMHVNSIRIHMGAPSGPRELIEAVWPDAFKETP
jgi:hypothetical protein